MSAATVEDVLAFVRHNDVETLDLTGGAPEMHPQFREIVTRARALGTRVIDRCNLTILGEPGQADLAMFLADNGVEIVASLPCYLEDNVDRQRGQGVFGASVDGLARLNALGYGVEGSGRVLNLVYNPQGPALPPAQADLEADYKRELMRRHGITFNRLYTLANMPIQRFGSMLVSKGKFGSYLQLLRSAHSAANLDNVMCRSVLSVDWQGYVYDCDFNQMLGLHLQADARPRTHLSEIDAAALAGRPIRVADHCYGCTAGQGSSCGGALAA
jgi:radical SAM/Cys-rich protein